VHCPGDQDIDFTFGSEIISTIPEDAVGRGGIAWEFKVEVPRVGVEDELFKLLG
jgi:hypothetical protein